MDLARTDKDRRVFVILLRGINVGGHRIVKMAALRTALEAAGFSDVQTYIQSGNIVARAGGDAAAVAERVRGLFDRDFGFVPQVLVLAASELAAAAARCPYPEEAAADGAKVHAFFLESEPTPEAIAALRGFDPGVDRWHLDGLVLYLHTPNGLGKSALAVRVERALRVPMTARGWRSVARVLEMAAATR